MDLFILCVIAVKIYGLKMAAIAPDSGGFRSCGARSGNNLRGSRLKIFFRPSVFFNFFSVEIVMLHNSALHFPIKTTQTGTSRESFFLGV